VAGRGRGAGSDEAEAGRLVRTRSPVARCRVRDLADASPRVSVGFGPPRMVPVPWWSWIWLSVRVSGELTLSVLFAPVSWCDRLDDRGEGGVTVLTAGATVGTTVLTAGAPSA